MATSTDFKVAILATDGFEKSELIEPKRQLEKAGAEVEILSLQAGSIKSWDEKDWGEAVRVDLTVAEADIDGYDALVLPGGQMNPDLLRVDDAAVQFIRDFAATGKPLAAICHAPWLLIEAGVINGRKVTSYHSISTDVKNAGGLWQDDSVVVDGSLITSRQPDDLDDFCRAILDSLRKQSGKQSAA
jgi:protease I